jgi:hypothetical protein
MTIMLDEKTIGIWYIQLSGKSDWLGHLAHADDGIHLTYRFRYYRGDQSLMFEESEDKKTWWEGVIHESRDKVVETMRQLVKHMCSADNLIRGDDCHEVIKEPDESLTQFMDRFNAMPFTLSKVVPPEDVKKMGLDIDGE